MKVSQDKPKRRVRKQSPDLLCYLAADVLEQAERLKTTAENLLQMAQSAKRGAR